jgi:hypothetical protein
MNADKIVNELLEDDHSEHVKAWDRVQKWDKAVSTYNDLRVLHREAEMKYREMGQALAIERALAHFGIQRADVAEWITGDRVGATHNYKRSVPVTACHNTYCEQRGRPVKNHDQEGCTSCGERLETTMKPVSPNELRSKYARYIVGVITNNGRKLWFNDPIPPKDYAGPGPKEIPAS